MLRRLTRYLARRRLKDPGYAFLFEPGPADEAVSIDCETTGLDRRKAEIVSVAAVRIRGSRVVTSEAFSATVRCRAAINPTAIKVHGLRERDVAMGQAMAEVLPELIKFIGGRPLVGYYLEFDVALINRYLRAWLGIGLPNRQIEISGLYYDRKYGDAPPGTHIDLTFASLARDLKLDLIDQHDALADATTAALMFVMLKDMQARRARIARAPYTPTAGFAGG
jgi:DNA polymerase-3 subunit epsilon